MVKNLQRDKRGKVHFHDIGPDLTTVQKLDIIRSFGSIGGIESSNGWRLITPDENNDWLDQVDRNFDKFMAIGSKKRQSQSAIFRNYSSGVKTNRDAWCVNYSRGSVSKNVEHSIDFYNSEVDRFAASDKKQSARNFAITDPTKISWDRTEYDGIERGRKISFESSSIVKTTYRPFTPAWMYFNRRFNNCVYQIPQIFPNSDEKNLMIQVSGSGARAGFSVLMIDAIPSYDLIEKGQGFPLSLFEVKKADGGLFASAVDRASGLTRSDAIADEGLAHFQAAYPGQEVSKEDLFFYIYGLLHSPEYRKRFKNNLAKQLPRIPAVKSFADFSAFRDAGRVLGDLHVNFENVEPYMVTYKEGDHRLIPEAQADPAKFYRVKHKTKWKFGSVGKEKDKSTVIYNENVTMENIPLEAYDYVVNGKPALEWVMERQVVKTDKASGIVNDANRYANETVGDPKYPLDLFQRIITVSLETIRIVQKLPKLDIDMKSN